MKHGDNFRRDRSASSFPPGWYVSIDDGTSSEDPDQTAHEQQVWVFACGVLLFLSGFLVLAIGFSVLGDSTGLSVFFMHALNTTGLLLMAHSDLDINAAAEENTPVSWAGYACVMTRRQMAAAVFSLVLAILVAQGLFEHNPVFVLCSLPAILWLGAWCRLYQARWCRTTQMVSALFSLALLAQGYGNILESASYTPSHPFAWTSCCYFMGSPLVWLSYFYGPRAATSISLATDKMRFEYASFAYLFVNGIGTGIEQAVKKSYYHYKIGKHRSAGAHVSTITYPELFIVPVSLIPTVYFILCHENMRGSLGRWWRKRLTSTDPDDEYLQKGGEGKKGQQPQDEYTELALASAAGNTALVREILERGEDVVNEGSKQRDWAPLYVAARFGRSQCVELLLKHHADPQKRTSDGQSAFGIAYYRKHGTVLMLLNEHTAEGGSDAELRPVRRSSVSTVYGGMLKITRCYEVTHHFCLNPSVFHCFVYFCFFQSHFKGNILEATDCKCIVSWPGIYCKLWCVCANSMHIAHSVAIDKCISGTS
jgi:hypothetical protein